MPGSAGQPTQSARMANLATRSSPPSKGGPASSGHPWARRDRQEFRNAEAELTDRSLAILRAAKEEGYEISLRDEKTVAVEEDKAGALSCRTAT